MIIPTRTDRIINVISSGSEVSGVLYAAAKRSSYRVARIDFHMASHHDPRIFQTIIFHLDESNYHNDPHDDSLVISLSIANCLTK